jgi:death on curing protein
LPAPDFLADLFRAISKFHDFTIERHGGLAGFRDEGLLRLSVERPWMTVFGEPLYGTPFQKAAAIADAIVRNHPFNDGNHRSALAAAHLVLGLFEIQLVASASEQRDSIRGLGVGNPNLDEFGAWLERNSVLRSQPAN